MGFSRSRSSSTSKSSYPKQTWGPGSSIGSPKPASTKFANFGGSRPVGTGLTGLGAGGFSKPNPTSYGSNVRKTAGAGVVGGVAGGYLGGGGFVAPKPASTNFGSSLGTRNNFGSNSGFGTSSGLGNTNNNFGSSSLSNTGRNNFGSNSGFGTNSNFGSSSFSNTGRSGSSFGKTAGAGLLGAGAGALGSKAFGSRSGFSKNPFGVSQYSAFGKPKRSFGSHLFGGKKSYGAKAPGYGTNWGTNFGGGIGKYGSGKKGFSKKALGLGVGAGFLGGAALGVGGTMATYGAIHKYKKFKNLLHGRRRYHHSRGYDDDWDDDQWGDDWDSENNWYRGRNYDRDRNYYSNYYEK